MNDLRTSSHNCAVTEPVEARARRSVWMVENNKGNAQEAAKRVCKPDLLAFVEAHNGK